VAETLAVSTANAAARRIEECEAISAPLAYNECLASFGPTRANRSGGAHVYAPATDAQEATHAPKRRISGVVVSRGRSGRVRMEFAPRR